MNYPQNHQKHTLQNNENGEIEEVLVFTNKKTKQSTCYDLKSIFEPSQPRAINQDLLSYLKTSYQLPPNEIKTTPSTSGSLCQEVLKAIRSQSTISLVIRHDYDTPIVVPLAPENLLIWPNYFLNIITTLHPYLSSHEMKKVLLFKTSTKDILMAQFYQDSKADKTLLNTKLKKMLEEQKKKQTVGFIYSICAPEKSGFKAQSDYLSPYNKAKNDMTKVQGFFASSRSKITEALRAMNAAQLYSLALDTASFSSPQELECEKNSISHLCDSFLSSNAYPCTTPKVIADFIEKYLLTIEAYWQSSLDQDVESHKILYNCSKAFFKSLTPKVLSEAFDIYLKKYNLTTLSMIRDLGVLQDFGFSDFLLKNLPSQIPLSSALPGHSLASIFTLLLNCALKAPIASLPRLNSLLQAAPLYFPAEENMAIFKAIQTMNLNFSRTQLLKDLVQNTTTSCTTPDQISSTLKDLQQLMSMVNLANEVFNNEKVGQSISTPQNLNSKFYVFLCEQQMILEKKLLSCSVGVPFETTKVMKI